MSQTENIYTKPDGEYLDSNPTWHVEDSPWKARQILKMLERNAILLKSIAEVGCGAGEILKQLYDQLPKELEYVGYDISKDAINIAESRANERIKFCHENLLETNEVFDLLLTIDVIEHVDDYLGFIRASKQRAKYHIFHIPLDMTVLGILRELPMNARNAVGHLHYFSKYTALATLKDCGYDIIDCFYTPGSIDLPANSVKGRMAILPRKMLFALNEDFAVKLLGGYSLMVLAK